MPATLRPLPAPPPLPVTHGGPSPLWRSRPASFEEIPSRQEPSFTPDPKLSLLPHPPETTNEDFPPSWPRPLAVLPAIFEQASIPSSPFAPLSSLASPGPDYPALPPAALASRLKPLAREPSAVPLPEPPRDFSDDDLREAFGPIIEHAVRNAVYARENGIDTYLEPMLRSTIRRALAEYTPTQRPFQVPGLLDRIVWRLQALFTSRTYEDIIFDKTHRFQVEEVFLLDVHSLALVSFASNQPGRHASAKRIEGTVQRLALQLRDATGTIRAEFELPEHRFAVSREGRFTVLVAVVRGRSNELVLADLEFALKRIEDHFRERFAPGGPPLLKDLQPFLEDCLLIQAPAHAA